MKSKNGFTEDQIKVKRIENGKIFLDDGLNVTGVKIIPRNIFILDKSTQNNVIANLRRVYDAIDYEFWIIAADRPVDINIYLSQLELLYNNVSSPIKRKMIMEDINKGNEFMNNNIVDTEYFLLFKEKNEDLIQKKLRSLVNNFASAGLNAHQTSNEDLRMILDNFLNGGNTTTFGTVLG